MLIGPGPGRENVKISLRVSLTKSSNGDSTIRETWLQFVIFSRPCFVSETREKRSPKYLVIETRGAPMLSGLVLRNPGKKIKQASLNGKFPFPASFWLIFWLGIRSNLKPIEIARSCLKFFSNSFLEPSEFSQNSALFNLAFSWWNL